VESWPTAAARNNGEWCDVIVRSHHALTRFDDDAWTSRTRTPPYYPDAVTLVPTPDVPDLLSRIDASPGCSIKDSFAALDLAPYGFHVLFDAAWIVRPSAATASAAPPRGWTRVRDRDGLSAWANAWRGEDGPTDLFRPELLLHASVAVLALYAHRRVVAGAILNRSSTVVGVSNVFATPESDDDGWSGCLAYAASIFPALPLVGYESGDEVVAVRDHGFTTAGPLRVWMFDG
jgi:hypothetical protein